MEQLLRRGAMKARDNGDGTMLLQQAAVSGNAVIIRLLLEHGAVVEDKHDTGNWDLLGYTAKAGHESIVRLLLNRGCYSSAEAQGSPNAQALLSRVAEAGHKTILQLLLDKGITVFENSSRKSQTLLEHATDRESEADV